MNKTEELGTASIRSLLVKYATPAIIAMMAVSLYNIVDSIFIGHGCGPVALAGLTIAKPFMDICAAFGSLVGVGAGALVAIMLGGKHYEMAGRVLGNVIVMNVVLSTLVMVVGLMWLDPILMSFGASDVTLAAAHDYMEIILFGNIATHLYFGLNNVLRSMGKPFHAMGATIVAVTINAILDPIFIFGLDMGVRGAALATVISQVTVVIWQITLFIPKTEVLHFHSSIWKLDGALTRRVISIGLSPFLMNLAQCVVVVVINNQLKHYGGDMALATYGIINRFIFVFAMMVMGLNQGMQPIAGYNYGAHQYDRMLRSFRLTAYVASIVMTAVCLLGLTIPGLLCRIFTDDMTLVADSIVPFRLVSCMMWLVGFQMVTGNFFTSIGRAGKAIFLSLTRQVLYLIPLLFLLPYLLEILPVCAHFSAMDTVGSTLLSSAFEGLSPIMGVWIAMPLSDVLAALTAAVLLKRELKKFA